MKFFLTLSLSLFSLASFAQNDLDSMKQKSTSYIDSKISNLKEAKDCINEADSMDRFKACKYDMKKQKMEDKWKMKKQMMEDKE